MCLKGFLQGGPLLLPSQLWSGNGYGAHCNLRSYLVIPTTYLYNFDVKRFESLKLECCCWWSYVQDDGQQVYVQPEVYLQPEQVQNELHVQSEPTESQVILECWPILFEAKYELNFFAAKRSLQITLSIQTHVHKSNVTVSSVRY